MAIIRSSNPCVITRASPAATLWLAHEATDNIPGATQAMSAEKQAQSINLSACRKLDSKVTKVIATASHVVMYSLRNGSEWQLMGAEGSLFIVKRYDTIDHAPPRLPAVNLLDCWTTQI